MNDRLKQFISDHRDEFDADEPGSRVWEDVERQVIPGLKAGAPPEKPGFAPDPSANPDAGAATESGATPSANPGKKKQAPVIRLQRAWMSVAAALILVIAGSVWYFAGHHSPKGPTPGYSPDAAPVAVSQAPAGAGRSGTHAEQPTADSPNAPKDLAANTPADSTTGKEAAAAKNGATAAAKPKDDKSAAAEYESTVNEEMYHYARLVELKHKQLKTIERDEPLLYRQFASDVNKLDSVYRSLQRQLPENPNREQLLEAMLQNLQLQMGLLTHQLDIIKQINHSKKAAYDKAYKTT